jgi:hypothetical protein
MKPLLILFCLFSAASYATCQDTLYVLKEAISWNYHHSGSGVLDAGSKFIFEYNTGLRHNLVSSAQRLQWNQVSATWDKKEQSHYIYQPTAPFRLDRIESFKWNAQVNRYNQPQDVEIFTYSIEGSNTKTIRYFKRYKHSDFEISSRETTIHDAKGRLLSQKSESHFTGKWLPSRNIENTYNQYHQLDISHQMEYNNIGELIKDTRTITRYRDTTTNNALDYILQTRNPKTGDWLNSTKYQFSYDSTGKLEKSIDYMWNKDTWKVIYETLYIYDEKTTTYMSIRGTDTIPVSRSTDTLNPTLGFLLGFTIQNFDKKQMRWWDYIKDTRVYAPVIAQSIVSPVPEVVLYPNPASTYVTLKNIDLSTVVPYRLYSRSGQLMLNGTLGAGESHIPVYDLPEGTYILQLDKEAFPPLKFVKQG